MRSSLLNVLTIVSLGCNFWAPQAFGKVRTSLNSPKLSCSATYFSKDGYPTLRTVRAEDFNETPKNENGLRRTIYGYNMTSIFDEKATATLSADIMVSSKTPNKALVIVEIKDGKMRANDYAELDMNSDRSISVSFSLDNPYPGIDSLNYGLTCKLVH